MPLTPNRAARIIQKSVRKRILPIRPRPVYTHQPLSNAVLKLLVAHGGLTPANVRALGNATRKPNNWEIQAIQNNNVRKRREAAAGRKPKIGPKAMYPTHFKFLRAIDRARRWYATHPNAANLRNNFPILNQKLVNLRKEVLRNLRHGVNNTHGVNKNNISINFRANNNGVVNKNTVVIFYDVVNGNGYVAMNVNMRPGGGITWEW